MPQSRHRQKHHQKHHPTEQHRITKPRAKRSVALILGLTSAIFGSVIGAFSSESELVWIIIGAVVGSIAGYLIGREADKSAADK